MLKIAGIICVLVGCIGYGIDRINKERSRIEHLREMIRIIRRIRDEISYGKYTLPEICLILSEYCSVLYQPYFRRIYEQTSRGNGTSFERIWEQQMRLCLRNAPLSDEEKDVLENMTRNLGMQEEKLQAQSIGQSVELLAERCKKAEDAYENKVRMIFSVSVLTGIFLTLLLL